MNQTCSFLLVSRHGGQRFLAILINQTMVLSVCLVHPCIEAHDAYYGIIIS